MWSVDFKVLYFQFIAKFYTGNLSIYYCRQLYV